MESATQSPPAQSTLESFNPATGELVGSVATITPDQVQAVVDDVGRIQPAWAELSLQDRARYMKRAADALLDEIDEIAELLVNEQGKPRAEAYTMELLPTVDALHWCAKAGPKILADEKVRMSQSFLMTKKSHFSYEPIGVVGVIAPWNYPWSIPFGEVAIALMAGNGVVLKPASLTPLLGEAIRRVFEKGGLPEGLVRVVHGGGAVGDALARSSVGKVFFTGSVEVGRKVGAVCAESLKGSVLELGGKDPMIVLRSANLEKAANAAAWGAFANTGQVCISVERLYVEEPIYDEFVARFTEEVKTLNQGMDGPEHGKELGAMTFPAQTKIVEDHVDDARNSGATVLTGGRRIDGQGDWYEPTVITGVDHSMKVMRDESFGPVVGVMKVRDSDEAVRLANDSRYGLSASVFGKTREAEAVARRLEVGTANVNDVLVGFLASDVPMGGWKDSGIGFRHGEYGIKKFVRPESLVITRFGRRREPLYFPYTDERRQQLRKLTRFFNARDWRRRLGRRSAPK
jgi:acyl-CoA reductase-like NAD-dependent aldehyde dehydrogenase